MVFTLKEFFANLKGIYGNVNITVNNVEAIPVVSVSSGLLDLDAKLIATNGVLSAHKTEQYEDTENDMYRLKSSVNVRKATWLAIASIGFKEGSDKSDNDVVVNILLNIVGDVKYEDIADDKASSIMRI